MGELAKPIAGLLVTPVIWNGTSWIQTPLSTNGRVYVDVGNVGGTDGLATDAKLATLLANMATPTFAFKEVLASSTELQTQSGGNQAVNGPTVPDDELWVVTHVTMLDNTHGVSSIVMRVMGPSTAVSFTRDYTIGAGVYLTKTGPFYFGPGNYIQAIFYGTTASDYLYVLQVGYKVALVT